MCPIDRDELLEAAIEDDNSGFCRACENHQYGCEPDAMNYECEECGRNEVFGAAELVLMGYAN